METRANYLLIGAFTIAGFLGLLAFFLWFARIEIDRQFSYYDVFFPSVSGISNASEVRFSGLSVGQVVDVRLDPGDSGQVVVRLEVAAGTPIRTSSLATIESLGVTGLSYVGISSGNPSDPLLEDSEFGDIPVILAGRSTLQTISEDAPAILDEILQVTKSVSELLGADNQERVAAILENVEVASGELEQALLAFSSATETVAAATDDFAAFAGRMEAVSEAAVSVLATADTTLSEMTTLAVRAGTTLDVADAALESGTRTLSSAGTFIEQDLPGVVESLDLSLALLRDEIKQVSDDASATLVELRQTSSVATDRLRQSEETIAEATRALGEISTAVASVETAAAQFGTLMAGDATALVNETRTLIADATVLANTAITIAETDLPAILTEVRSATETVSEVVTVVGADLTKVTGRAEGLTEDIAVTLATVTETFENANGTLAQLNTTLASGDAALIAAESAFSSADRVLTDDIGQMASSLQATMTRLEDAIDLVAADIPVITSELRETATNANSAFGEMERAAATLGPSLTSFANQGLPEYARLARETRSLVVNLRQLVRQLEREPTRLLFGTEAPEFRR